MPETPSGKENHLPNRYHLYVDGKLYSVHRSQKAADGNVASVGKAFPDRKIELREIAPGHKDYGLRFAFYKGASRTGN